MNALVSPARLKAMLHDGAELALLDVREEGPFSNGHLLYASSLPLSRLELLIRDLVPRKTVRMVLCDDGAGLAARAADKLDELGYTDIATLDGGVRAWSTAAYELFSGVHVPSKAFGEYVEHHYDTPRITAEGLKQLRDAGEDVVILDSRPMDEYLVMNIPGGIDVPGAELAYRVHDLAPASKTRVVVNCAGRTRSIIGAQSLINAGIPNPVMALKDGTMGWHLAGLALEHGQLRNYGAVTERGQVRAQEVAARVAKRFGVATIDRDSLTTWQAEADNRSLYLFDVRQPAEFESGHYPGSINAPGGQLVQATDAYIGTLGARIVLIDDTGVRATMTASWLIQMGWDHVAVLADGLAGAELETGPHRTQVPGLDDIQVTEVASDALAAEQAAGSVQVIDLAHSNSYRYGHVPGAWYAVRTRLQQAMENILPAEAIVLTSEDGNLARLAAAEAATLTEVPVRVLGGGTAAWSAAGLPLHEGAERMADDPDDAWLKPYDYESDVERRMRDYLAWETELVSAIERDGDARFRLFPPS